MGSMSFTRRGHHHAHKLVTLKLAQSPIKVVSSVISRRTTTTFIEEILHCTSLHGRRHFKVINSDTCEVVVAGVADLVALPLRAQALPHRHRHSGQLRLCSAPLRCPRRSTSVVDVTAGFSQSLLSSDMVSIAFSQRTHRQSNEVTAFHGYTSQCRHTRRIAHDVSCARRNPQYVKQPK